MGRPRKIQEVVAEGIIRENEIENPNDAPVEPSVEGKWIKATYEELCKYEADGVLIGFKPDSMEVLLTKGV